MISPCLDNTPQFDVAVFVVVTAFSILPVFLAKQGLLTPLLEATVQMITVFVEGLSRAWGTSLVLNI